MKVKMNGGPDDIIQKCKKCKFCIFEHILTKEQRKIKVLDLKIPEKHLHRNVVEQLCGKNYDGVCPMKYAAMRASCDDRTAMQMGVVNIYILDIGKKNKEDINFEKAFLEWGRNKNKNGQEDNSYANRFKQIWEMGIREVYIDEEFITKQIFTVDYIYEVVMCDTEIYNDMLKHFAQLIKLHKDRDAIK